jgi:hypothetical protein
MSDAGGKASPEAPKGGGRGLPAEHLVRSRSVNSYTTSRVLGNTVHARASTHPS